MLISPFDDVEIDLETGKVHEAGELERHWVEDRPKSMVSVVHHERDEPDGVNGLI